MASTSYSLIFSQSLCKMNCGYSTAPGLTRNGNPYDTCCRDCAVSSGDNHHISCHQRNNNNNNNHNNIHSKFGSIY